MYDDAARGDGWIRGQTRYGGLSSDLRSRNISPRPGPGRFQGLGGPGGVTHVTYFTAKVTDLYNKLFIPDNTMRLIMAQTHKVVGISHLTAAGGRHISQSTPLSLFAPQKEIFSTPTPRTAPSHISSQDITAQGENGRWIAL